MMRLKYSTVAALASVGPANCVGSAGSSADSRGARDFGSSRFMPSSGASSSKCGVTLPMSGKSARHEENYHLRGSYGQDWGRNRAGRSLSPNILGTSSNTGIDGLVGYTLGSTMSERSTRMIDSSPAELNLASSS